MNGAVLAARPMVGKEQWLEVRWKLSDAVQKFGAAAPGAYQTTDILIGNGGNWVFLIGKKQLL